MRNPIYKRLKRQLLRNVGQYLAISTIFLVMLTVIGGFLIAANGNQRGLNDALESCLQEDGEFSVSEHLTSEFLDAIEALGVSLYANDYLEYEYDSYFTLRVFANRVSVNLPKIHEGRIPESPNEIAIDALYAKNRNLNLNDNFTIGTKNYLLVGLVWLPDYSSPFKNNADLAMDAQHFGVALVNKQAFDSFPTSQITVNYAWRYNDSSLSDTEQFDLSEDIKDELFSGTVALKSALKSFTRAQDNQAISYVLDDFGTDVPMMLGFLIVMMLILAFVIAIIINHTITAEAGAIGALAATGMRRRELLCHYLLLPFLVMLASGILGCILCMTLTYRLFDRMYHTAYSLPPIDNLWDPQTLLFVLLLPIICMLVITGFSLLRKLGLMPVRFLRGELRSRKNMRTRRALPLPNFAFIRRFTMRILISNKGSFVLLFAGIFLANFVLILGLVLGPSIANYVEKIEDDAVAKYQYILKRPAELQGKSKDESQGDTQSGLQDGLTANGNLSSIDNLQASGNGESTAKNTVKQQEDDSSAANAAEKFYILSAEYVSRSGQIFDLSLLGIVRDSSYLTKVNLHDGTVLASESFCKKFKLQAEDVIEIKDAQTNKTYSFVIGEDYPYSGGFALIMPIEEMNNLFDNPDGYFNGYFSDKILDIDDEVIATTITPEVLRGAGEQMLSMFGEMMFICLLAAIVVHLVLSVLLTKLLLEKNARNIALMKIFGYRVQELRRVFLNASTVVVIFSLLATLLPVQLGATVMFQDFMMSKMSGYLEIQTQWWVYFVLVGVGLVCYLFVMLLQMRKIGKVDMGQALKGAE